MSRQVSIVILNYKNYTDTIACMETVYDIDYDNYRVIVVDNDSQNDSLEHISGWLDTAGKPFTLLTQNESENEPWVDDKTVLIQSRSNCGYAAGNNIGIRWAIRGQADYILILNNDTLVEKGFIEPLVNFLETHPDAAMAGPKILDVNGGIDHNCARRRPTLAGYFWRLGLGSRLWPKNPWYRKHYYIGEYDFNEPRQVDVIAGSCMLIRSDVLAQVGCLDESTFLFLEEFILCEKLKTLHKRTVIVPSSVIIHKGGSSMKASPSLFVLEKGIESFYFYLTKYRKLPSLIARFLMCGQYLRYYFWLIRLSIKNG